MVHDTVPCFDFPAAERKGVTAAFPGGRFTSDGGFMLLSSAERRLGIAERLARLIPGRRNPTRITHRFGEIRARIFAFCCGYGAVTISMPCAPIRVKARRRPAARHWGEPRAR